MAVFGHIWPYLPIGCPSYLKLVGHCLNKVEHCIPHLGGGMDPFGHIKNCPVGEGKAAMAKYCQIWLKNGCFRGPLMPSRVILVGQRGPSGPPRCGIQFRVQPVFNQFEAGKATYGQIWPKMAKNGRFGGPLRPPTVILVGAKESKCPISDVGYDGQQCSTSVKPI